MKLNGRFLVHQSVPPNIDLAFVLSQKGDEVTGTVSFNDGGGDQEGKVLGKASGDTVDLVVTFAGNHRGRYYWQVGPDHYMIKDSGFTEDLTYPGHRATLSSKDNFYREGP